MSIHLNPSSVLPPVGCLLLIEYGGKLIKVERTSHVDNKSSDLEYVTETGKVLVGKFKWTYP